MTTDRPGPTVERWSKMPLLEQMANIGSEVERAINWRDKKNEANAQLAFERAMDLFDLSLSVSKEYPRLKEIARAKEAWADYFAGANQFQADAAGWKRYFTQFALASRKNT